MHVFFLATLVVLFSLLTHYVALAQAPSPMPKPAPYLTPKNDMMEQWNFAPQRRLGRYKVLMPSTVRANERLRLVVMLHGNGNAPDVMVQLARDLNLGKVIVVCPEAPYVKIPETIDSRTEKYSAIELPSGASDDQLRQVVELSAEWYTNVIEDAKRTLPIDTTQRTTLIGFSQGGFFAHVLLTRHPEQFSHVVSISASMYSAGDVLERYESVKPFPVKVMVAHGTTDDIVPFQTGELIHSNLERAGLDHKWMPFEGGHWPSTAVQDAIRTFVR